MKRFILILLCLAFLFPLCSCGGASEVEAARKSGYDAGYKDGYAAGYEDGLRDGVDKGDEIAYNEGYKNGRTEKQVSLVGLFPSVSTAATASEPNYILNTNTKKFHYPDCSSVDQMKEKNKEPFYGTRDEAIAQGYSPCGRCKP